MTLLLAQLGVASIADLRRLLRVVAAGMSFMALQWAAGEVSLGVVRATVDAFGPDWPET